ncbi:unnamed protein product [Tuber aestivum]|uniref:Uncharacterized protein n=1 Tax=Tuber aestivum TaxID=59557 RepID=A0A292PRU2_9PEZI|nr:unnamed protein product [Tuber aestivum]
MSSPDASENTSLLPGPSDPIPGGYGIHKVLMRIFAHFTFLVASTVIPVLTYYTVGGGKTISDISDENPTWFTIEPGFVILYWCIMMLLQTKYVLGFSSMRCCTEMGCQRPARLGISFILHNIFTILWAFLFAHSLSGWSESILFLNFIQLCIGCGMDHESLLGRLRLEGTCRGQGARPVSYRCLCEFRFINRLAVLSLPLTLTVYMIPWNIAVDLSRQESISHDIAIFAIFLLDLYGSVFMHLQDCAVGFASAFLAIGLLVQQWGNPDKWYAWLTVVYAVVTCIYSILAAII